jgi:hypothetical protein
VLRLQIMIFGVPVPESGRLSSDHPGLWELVMIF